MDLRTELNLIKEKQHMTNQQIADGAGIPVGTVSSIFSGQTARPSFQDVVAILTFFNVSIDDFCGLDFPRSEPVAPPAPSPAPEQHPPISVMREEVADACRGAIRDVLTSYVHKTQHGNLLWWRWMAMGEMLLIIGILIWDITHPSMGYIQYSAAMMPSAKDMLAALRALI